VVCSHDCSLERFGPVIIPDPPAPPRRCKGRPLNCCGPLLRWPGKVASGIKALSKNKSKEKVNLNETNEMSWH